MKFYLLFQFSLLSIFFMLIAIKIIFENRPIFIPIKSHMYLLMGLVNMPLIINFMVFLNKKDISNIDGTILIILIIIFILVIFFMVWTITIKKLEEIYLGLGVSNRSFKEALYFSLNKNNLPFEEQLPIIKLTSINTKLKVVQSKDGIRIILEETTDKYILLKIMTGINDYYIENNEIHHDITVKVYIQLSIFMFMFGWGFFFLFSYFL